MRAHAIEVSRRVRGWTTALGGKGRRRQPLFDCRYGATAVEFAIVAPVFLIMVIGIFEISRALWIKGSMQYAVEETARYAIVNTSTDTTTLATYAQSKFSDSGVSAPGISFTAAQDTTGSIDYVTISASYNFQVIVTLVPFPDVTLTAKARIPLK